MQARQPGAQLGRSWGQTQPDPPPDPPPDSAGPISGLSRTSRTSRTHLAPGTWHLVPGQARTPGAWRLAPSTWHLVIGCWDGPRASSCVTHDSVVE